MYIIVIGWLYVAMMMSVAEATNTNGTVLGAVFTFFIYGLLPVALLGYILATPARKRARAARMAREDEASVAIAPAAGVAADPDAAASASPRVAVEPDGSGEAATDAVPPVRKES